MSIGEDKIIAKKSATFAINNNAGRSQALRAVGFHQNFAPVVDVDSNPANPVIGDRAFSNDPNKIADFIFEVWLAQLIMCFSSTA